MNYYIKTIWGPNAYDYPEDDNIIGLTDKNASERFKNCDGFLLYETGREKNGKKGLSVIYGWGTISDNQEIGDSDRTEMVEGREFGYPVRVEIKKRVRCENGIPISKLRGLGINQFQSRGGLIRITDEQFDELLQELKSIID